MLILIVRKTGWQKSPWHSWTREFVDEQEFLAWFHAQAEDSYIKQVASQPEYRDKCFRLLRLDNATPNRNLALELLAPWAPPG